MKTIGKTIIFAILGIILGFLLLLKLLIKTDGLDLFKESIVRAVCKLLFGEDCIPNYARLSRWKRNDYYNQYGRHRVTYYKPYFQEEGNDDYNSKY